MVVVFGWLLMLLNKLKLDEVEWMLGWCMIYGVSQFLDVSMFLFILLIIDDLIFGDVVLINYFWVIEFGNCLMFIGDYFELNWENFEVLIQDFVNCVIFCGGVMVEDFEFLFYCVMLFLISDVFFSFVSMGQIFEDVEIQLI